MNLVLAIYSALAAVVTAALLVSLAAGRLREGRRRCRDAVLRRRYLGILLSARAAYGEEIPHFPLLGCAGSREVLTQAVARLAGTVCGVDTERLRRIVVRYRLDDWLLRRIRLSRGYRRARYLRMLTYLPSGADKNAAVARYARSRNRCVRFYALTARLSGDPAMALHLMADYVSPFSAAEIAGIMTVLRCGMLPVACEPLLGSPDRNLRLVGMGIVRRFGIVGAVRQLLRMVADDEAPEVGREALYTLLSLYRLPSRREAAGRLEAMSAAERRSLLRYMALEGYAAGTFGQLFVGEERRYYEALVRSYKRSLA